MLWLLSCPALTGRSFPFSQSLTCSSKLKKILASSSKASPSPENALSKRPHPDSCSSKTTEEAANADRRIRNRGSALSLKEEREAAQKPRQPRSDPNGSRPDTLLTPSVERIPLFSESSQPDSSIKLPERYEILDKFFISLDISIRLLGLKRSRTTFTNISPKIERLTHRRFTYSHLAQLKFIWPEAIVIKNIWVHDERTNSTKPDLDIALRIQAIENNGSLESQSGNVELRKAFRLRLLGFFKAHPEGDDVPEEALPEPSNLSNTSAVGATPTVASLEHQPIVASHFAESFTRRFSK